MTIFTLHSHHHFEWNKVQKHANTGTNVTLDSSDCPICGYLFGAEFKPALDVKCLFSNYRLVHHTHTQFIEKALFTPVLGRSPPVTS